jgi:hypothetical protein
MVKLLMVLAREFFFNSVKYFKGNKYMKDRYGNSDEAINFLEEFARNPQTETIYKQNASDKQCYNVTTPLKEVSSKFT